MDPTAPSPPLPIDLARPDRDERAVMAAEVRAGLDSDLPTIPSKYFYDDRGSALFDEITRLPEYYLTRTEERILEDHADDIARRADALELVELGSGMGAKLRRLLGALGRGGRLESCVLFDVNRRALEESLARLAEEYPRIAFSGLVGDFLEDLHALGAAERRLVAFLGSTIGNLHPRQVTPFLARLACTLSPGGALLLGLDLVKDPARLHAAYNDAKGVTARFNRNILSVVNARLGADFDPKAFDHVAFYDAEQSWIEMRLRARRDMRVSVPGAGVEMRLRRGDEIRTEISCKYTRPALDRLAEGTGLAVESWYTDRDALFAVALLRRTRGTAPRR
jgi:L-histidine Nalpha-methyltransferase